jgi:Domain of unknown function (DUF4340)
MNRKLTIGLLLVFAVLGVYAWVVQMPKDNAAANTTPTVTPVVYLWTVQADQINGVHVVDHVSGQAMDLLKDAAGTWSLVQPGPQPAEQSLAASDVSGLMTLAVDGTITTSTDLGSFGVLSPTMTVEVDLSDGTKLKAAVGNKSPTGTDYYVLRAGETQVVLLSTAAQGTLASLVTTPPVVPPTATPTVPTPGPGTPSVTPPASATVAITATVAATVTVPVTAGTPGAVATISLYGPTATAPISSPTP